MNVPPKKLEEPAFSYAISNFDNPQEACKSQDGVSKPLSY